MCNNEDFQCNCNKEEVDCAKCMQDTMLENGSFFKLADSFKVFADPTRLKIIYILLKAELCVCDIARAVNMSQSSISHQLRVLKSAGMVKFRKEGKVVYYSLDDEHVSLIFKAGLEHMEHK